jgi:hypothetical protein
MKSPPGLTCNSIISSLEALNGQHFQSSSINFSEQQNNKNRLPAG